MLMRLHIQHSATNCISKTNIYISTIPLKYIVQWELLAKYFRFLDIVLPPFTSIQVCKSRVLIMNHEQHSDMQTYID
jgi:hypothetical protein